MNVCLVDYDGKIPNLALMKLSSFHKDQGDNVVLCRGKDEIPLGMDEIYVSCLFRWNRQKVMDKYGALNNVEIGGTGWDIYKALPMDVQWHDPDYTIYGNDFAIGFISRGCPNNCPWCVVPRKEGDIARVSTAEDIVEGRRRVIFLDNNFLAMDECENDLGWLVASKVKTDFNQGLDARRVDGYRAMLLSKVKWTSEIRFALDNVGQRKDIERVFGLLTNLRVRPSKIAVYVLIGFNGFESDVERLWCVHELGGRPIPMGYRNVDTGEQPRTGWDYKLYQKYKRLIFRIPFAKSVWQSFEKELMKGKR